MAPDGERGARLRSARRALGSVPLHRPAERHVRRGGETLPGRDRRRAAALRRLGRTGHDEGHRCRAARIPGASLGEGLSVAAPYAFGVIPARGGSKGLPGKNLRRLGALSLIGHAIASAREATRLTRFVVSTDSEEIAAEAERQALPVPFLRPGGLATDEAGMLGVLQHAVRWLESSAGVRPDVIVTLQPTSPFRTGTEIDVTIQKVIETGADSAQTLSEASYHPYFMKTLDG